MHILYIIYCIHKWEKSWTKAWLEIIPAMIASLEREAYPFFLWIWDMLPNLINKYWGYRFLEKSFICLIRKKRKVNFGVFQDSFQPTTEHLHHTNFFDSHLLCVSATMRVQTEIYSTEQAFDESKILFYPFFQMLKFNFLPVVWFSNYHYLPT